MLTLTRPAVSIALSKFEQDLGFQLFHRSKGYFEPTDEAQLLHHETEQGLLSIERIKTRAMQIRGGGVGVINISSNGACAINLLPWVIADFQKVHTGVRIDLLVRSSRKIASWVAGRQSDIGLIDAPGSIPGLTTEIIRSRCVVVLPQDHPLAQETVLYPHHLQDQSIIAITGDHSIDILRLRAIWCARGRGWRLSMRSMVWLIWGMVSSGVHFSRQSILNWRS